MQELDSKLLKVKRSHFAIVFVDLKGAFESVSHLVIHKLYSLTNKKLANITKSYLGNRNAFIYNNNFKDCNPKLQYMENRSTPQGSKVSPTIFSHNLGVICHWYCSRIEQLATKLEFGTDMVAYADDAAIIVSSEKGPEHLEYCIRVCASSFREIANLLGGELEPSKTEVLTPLNRTWSNVKSMCAEDVAVEIMSSVR